MLHREHTFLCLSMDYAVLYGFNKALTSCEHCIATDLMGKFNRMLQHMATGMGGGACLGFKEFQTTLVKRLRRPET